MTDPRSVGPARRLSDHQVFLAMTVMTAIALAIALFASRTINPLRGDSAEYLYFDPSRTVGYPAFLWAVRALTGEVKFAVSIQLVLLAASLLQLGWSFHKFVLRPAASLAFYALLVAQAGMWFLSDFLMTEALATALVALWCAELLRASQTPSSRKVVWLVALSAIATMVRAPLVTLFLGTALFYIAILAGKELRRALILTGAGLAIAWAATPAAQFLVHGSPRTTSPVARGVLQHTLYCSVPSVPGDPDSRLVEAEAAPVRRYIDAAPAATREQFRRAYSTPLRFGHIIPLLGRRHHFDRRSDVDSDLTRIAAERVEANPLCYGGSVVNEYLRLATFTTDPTSEDAVAINRFMQRHPPVGVAQYPVLPGDELMARRAARDVQEPPSGLNPERFHIEVVGNVPLVALLPIRLLCAAASVLGLLFLACVPIRRRLPASAQQLIPPAAAMGLAFHGALIITAIVEIGFYRYLVPFWPVICALTVLGICSLAGMRRRFAGTATDVLVVA